MTVDSELAEKPPDPEPEPKPQSEPEQELERVAAEGAEAGAGEEATPGLTAEPAEKPAARTETGPLLVGESAGLKRGVPGGGG